MQTFADSSGEKGLSRDFLIVSGFLIKGGESCAASKRQGLCLLPALEQALICLGEAKCASAAVPEPHLLIVPSDPRLLLQAAQPVGMEKYSAAQIPQKRCPLNTKNKAWEESGCRGYLDTFMRFQSQLASKLQSAEYIPARGRLWHTQDSLSIKS